MSINWLTPNKITRNSSGLDITISERNKGKTISITFKNDTYKNFEQEGSSYIALGLNNEEKNTLVFKKSDKAHGLKLYYPKKGNPYITAMHDDTVAALKKFIGSYKLCVFYPDVTKGESGTHCIRCTSKE